MAVAVPPETAAGVPPHNEEAEASVLGAILLTEQALDGVLLEVGLRSHDFYRPRHAAIFQAMIRLKEKATPEAVDALTVAEELRRSGDLEKAARGICTRCRRSCRPCAVLDYARIVKEHSLLRSILTATREIQDDVGGAPWRGARADRARRGVLFKIGHDGGASEMRVARGDPAREIDKLEELSRPTSGSPARPPASPTSTRSPADSARQPDRARSAALDGKERSRHQLAEYAAVEAVVPVALFSLEIPRPRLSHRFLASQPASRATICARAACAPKVAEGAEGGREARARPNLRGRLERYERARACARSRAGWPRATASAWSSWTICS